MYVIHCRAENARRETLITDRSLPPPAAGISVRTCRNKTLIPKDKISQKISREILYARSATVAILSAAREKAAGVYADRAQSAAGVLRTPAGAVISQPIRMINFLCEDARIK